MKLSDLLKFPTSNPKTTGRSAKREPSCHLMSQEALKFIEESHKKTAAKEKREEANQKIKKEAL